MRAQFYCEIMGDDQVRFGCHIMSFGDVWRTVRYSVLAEKSGFDTLTFPDHLFHPKVEQFFTEPAWEVFTVLTAVWSKTNKVKLMPAVADAVRHHPAEIAHTIATLDHITGGRIMLGLGTGEAFNVLPLENVRWDKPYTRLKEALQIIKMFWASGMEKPVTFHGEYFRVKEACLGFRPLQRPHPPIYIGGYGPKLRELAGVEGNGWIPWIHAPKLYKHDLGLVIEAAKKAGRDPKEVDPAVIVYTVVSSDSKEAWERIAPRCKIALTLRPALLEGLGYPELSDRSLAMWKMPFTQEKSIKVSDLSKRIPMDAVKEVAVAGTAEEAIRQIQNFIDAGARHLVLLPLIPWFEETIKGYKDTIIQYFKEYSSK